MAAYVERMKPEQDAIYYILGDDVHSIVSSPHLDYFRKHELEVLYLTEPLDRLHGRDAQRLQRQEVAERR